MVQRASCLRSPASGFLHSKGSATRSRGSSAETPFVRTYVAVYFLSLLLCNLAQAIGALLNIPWIVEKRVYIGTLCTTQATIQQIGNVRMLCRAT